MRTLYWFNNDSMSYSWQREHLDLCRLWENRSVYTVSDWNTLWLNLMKQPSAARSINTVGKYKKMFSQGQEWTSMLKLLVCRLVFCSFLLDGKLFTRKQSHSAGCWFSTKGGCWGLHLCHLSGKSSNSSSSSRFGRKSTPTDQHLQL